MSVTETSYRNPQSVFGGFFTEVHSLPRSILFPGPVQYFTTFKKCRQKEQKYRCKLINKSFIARLNDLFLSL